MKHAFYTRERRFCSLSCARGSTDGPPQPSTGDPETSAPASPYEFRVKSISVS